MWRFIGISEIFQISYRNIRRFSCIVSEVFSSILSKFRFFFFKYHIGISKVFRGIGIVNKIGIVLLQILTIILNSIMPFTVSPQGSGDNIRSYGRCQTHVQFVHLIPAIQSWLPLVYCTFDHAFMRYVTCVWLIKLHISEYYIGCKI